MVNFKTKNWEIKNIETVVFDKDGTIIDLHFFWGKMTELRALKIIEIFNLDKENFNKICLYLGYDVVLKKMLKDGITALYSRSKIIEIFKNNLLELDVKTTISKLEEIFDCVSVDFYKSMEKYTKPIETAIDFIQKLKEKNIKMGIVTSDSVESTNRTIEYFNWNYFDFVVGRESYPFSKESGVPLKNILEENKIEKQNIVMIGDAPMDYFCAKNGGVDKTILVATGQIELEELNKTSNYSVENLSEIEIY